MSNLGRSIFLLFLVLAGGASTAFAQTATLRIQIYDYASLEPKTLSQVLISMEDILASSGLTARVSLCKGSLELSCDAAAPVGPVIRIVQGEAKAKNVSRPTLGKSYAGHEGGTYATVFLRAAQEDAADANVPWAVVLAHAAAHEVGHLLMGDSHALRGLMKVAWNRNDYHDMVQSGLHFTDEEARKIARRYASAR
jgi:hypothetical protein